MENIKEKYMEKNFNNIIKEIRKCNICEDKFGTAMKVGNSREYSYYCPDKKVWEETGYFNKNM